MARTYSKEFKEEAIKLGLEIGSWQASEKLEIPNGTIDCWLYKARKAEKKVSVPSKKEETASVRELQERIRELEKENGRIKKENEFVSGRGKRKDNIQKLLEALYSYQGRQKGYDESNATFKGRNSYSKTDKDATFMRMKDDYMRNGQLKPAYNVQLAIEAEYVVGAGIFSDCNDIYTLKPMVESILSYNANMTIKRLTADSGYESEENYVYLESKGIDCYTQRQKDLPM